MKKGGIVIIVIILFIIAFGAWYYIAKAPSQMQDNNSVATNETQATENTEENGTSSGTESGDMKGMNMEVSETSGDSEAPVVADETNGKVDAVEITVKGTNFQFSKDTIKVDKGDTVRLTFVNTGGTHNWKLEGYNGVGTKTIQTGEQETVEFTADKAGEFAYYCSIGRHRALGMEGTLIVE